MADTFHTLQEFLAYTKGAIYVLSVVILFVLLGFWNFLVGKDED